MANRNMGTHASIGPDLSNPMRSRPQPHWKIATSTP
jgi:hypothetical protein